MSNEDKILATERAESSPPRAVASPDLSEYFRAVDELLARVADGRDLIEKNEIPIGRAFYMVERQAERVRILQAKPVDSNAAVDSSGLIFADGYCARCSEFSRPLTGALAITGVPTGAAYWQQTYGPNKVRALADYENCLRRLVNVMNDPQSKQAAVAEARERAEFISSFTPVYTES